VIRLRTLALLALPQLLACASELQDDLPEDDTSTSSSGKGSATGGAGHAGGLAYAGTTSAGATHTTTAGSNNGGNSSAGSAGRSSNTNGGSAGSAPNGGAGNAGVSTLGGAAGGPNQPPQCDEATAIVLGTMNSNITVASNVCLKMTLPADQTWIKKITLQPDSGMYPMPFTWSNCGTNSSGAFTANYANAILNPVTAQCPILVKLGGNGAAINVQWWGG
jgi:hypothetical protein